MKIKLDPQQGFIKNGKFDQYEALKNAGVKAAVCFKETQNGVAISPEEIRQTESETTLIVRGINTIYQDHTTPTEQQTVNLEITGIPKILCMILNNQHQYSADERSLRYTEIEPNDYISELETKLYFKWLDKIETLIQNQYNEFYLKINSNNISKAKKAIHKIAQENARYMVSVFQPTVLTYSVPWIQINKIATYMQQVINKPLNKFEKKLIPYFKEFINQLIDLNVLITKDNIYELVEKYPDIKEKLLKTKPEILNYNSDKTLLYKNNKNIELSLFAYRNKFSGIKEENEYGYNVMYNNYESFACLAQEQRHRTIYCEMDFSKSEEGTTSFFVPPILYSSHNLVLEWLNDMEKIRKYYVQGELVRVSRKAPIENILKFVATERACDRAQLEIEKVYTECIIPDIYNGLLEKQNIELSEKIKPYVKKLRCSFPNYKCPSPCGHPRLDRNL